MRVVPATCPADRPAGVVPPGGRVHVFVRGGRLRLRTLSPIPVLHRGVVLHPDDDADPDIFRIDLSQYGMAPARVVFARDTAGDTTAVHFDGLPLSAQRRGTRR